MSAALAVGARVVLYAPSRMARTVTGVSLGPLLLPGDPTVIPAHANFAAFSPMYPERTGVAAACPMIAKTF